MKKRLLMLYLFLLLAEPSVITAADSEFIKVYHDAIATESQAYEDFREARSVSVAYALKIPLEIAKEQMNFPSPERKMIDVSIFGKRRLLPSQAANYRSTIRALHSELDEMIAATRRLLEQLHDEEKRIELGTDISPESFLSQMQAAIHASALASEDDWARAKDMTNDTNGAPLPPSADARNDALIAAQAAAQAARSAAHAQARADAAGLKMAVAERQALTAAALTAKQAASDSAAAARKASQAHSAAIAAAQALDRESELLEADKASRAAAEAVYHAMLAAIAAGELEASKLAQMSGIGQQAAGSDQANTEAMGRDKQGYGFRMGGDGGSGGSAPRDTGMSAPSNPGLSTPSRGISAIGEAGTGWIRLDSWYILGPFPNPRRQNVDVSFPPETLVDLDALYQGEGGRSIRWMFVQVDGEMVSPPEDLPYVIYYAYTEVFSDADRDLWVAVGSDDNSRIWLNDKLIWKSGYGLKTWKRNEGFRRVLFRRGINRVLYRVENGHGRSGFSFIIQTNPEALN